MSDHPFPPEDPKTFLTLCAGEWMSLRSSFELSEGDDDWHASERGELKVSYDQGADQSVGRLEVVPPSGHASRLEFSANGRLAILGGAQETTGLWRFWPDGAWVDLPQADGVVVQERIGSPREPACADRGWGGPSSRKFLHGHPARLETGHDGRRHTDSTW